MGNYHDIVSHEFTHGVIRNSSALAREDEPGALNESFADIFGLMAERITVNGEVETNLTWAYGHSDIFQRYFNNPNAGGRHLKADCSGFDLGQPDTYGGLYWTDFDCPGTNGDKHSKGGVQNFWFYLLSEGGSGTNDIGESYSVSGIGETKASKIAYWSMVNEMMTSSQFSDARAGAESAAILLYGECSNEHIQTVNAWHAVGVGEQSACSGASITRLSDPTTFHIYPNPMADQFAIVWDTEKVFDVTLYSIDGKILFIQKGVTSGDFIIPPSISKGIYFVEARSGEKIIRKQVIKN